MDGRRTKMAAKRASRKTSSKAKRSRKAAPKFTAKQQAQFRQALIERKTRAATEDE